MKKNDIKGFHLERVAVDSLPQTEEELSELEQKACEGDPEALSTLICSCVPFAWKVYVNRSKLQNGHYCQDDGLQDAMLKILTEVIENYDYRKGHFKHYVSKWLPGSVIKTSLDSAKHGVTFLSRKTKSESDGEEFIDNRFISINSPVFDNDGNESGEFGDTLASGDKTLDDDLCDKQLCDVINTVLLSVLSNEERIAIELYFGFRCPESNSINGKKMNSLISRSLLKIRSSPYMYQLKEFYAA